MQKFLQPIVFIGSSSISFVTIISVWMLMLVIARFPLDRAIIDFEVNCEQVEAMLNSKFENYHNKNKEIFDVLVKENIICDKGIWQQKALSIITSRPVIYGIPLVFSLSVSLWIASKVKSSTKKSIQRSKKT